jgi:large repetitive protein
VKDFAGGVVDHIKEDPLQFVGEVAAGVAAAAAVGLICSTGVGCVILAGAVAGAVSAGYGYGYDVAQGEHPWDWGDFGKDVAIGGVTGAATAGLLHGAGKLVKGGLSKLRGGGGKPSAAPADAPSPTKAAAPKPPRPSPGEAGGRQAVQLASAVGQGQGVGT